MIIACILSALACFIAEANEDRYMEKMNRRETQHDDRTEN